MTISRMVLAAALAGTAALAGADGGGAQSAHTIKIGGLFTARVLMVPEMEQFHTGTAPGPDQAAEGLTGLPPWPGRKPRGNGCRRAGVFRRSARLCWDGAWALRNPRPPRLYGRRNLKSGSSRAPIGHVNHSWWSMAAQLTARPNNSKACGILGAELVGAGWQTIKFERVGSYYRGVLLPAA